MDELVQRIEALEKQQREEQMLIKELTSVTKMLADRVVEMGEIFTMMRK